MDEDKYIEYYQSLIDNDTKNIHLLQKKIDDYVYPTKDDTYNNYPDHHTPDFIYELSNKLEYSHKKTLLNISDLSKKCPSKDINDLNIDRGFELSNNQQFLRNFINRRTPYRGLVIFHGVGVGKTCSAINISNSFLDTEVLGNDRIICLVPKNIRGGWENTIYDKTKGSGQCSGNSFEDIIKSSFYHGKVSDKKVRSIINNYYEFYGYLKFANYVKKLIKNGIGNKKLDKETYNKMEREIIREKFSNRVLIIDEVHNLREENDGINKGDIKKRIKKGSYVSWEDKDGLFRYGEVLSFSEESSGLIYSILREDTNEVEKVHNNGIQNESDGNQKAREIIDKVIDYSEGLRLIMLSATPMFNKSSEIIWLLNLLLKNDNRPILSYDEIFRDPGGMDRRSTARGGPGGRLSSANEVLTKKGIDIIRKKSTGYFSYLRGENPISFPIRVHPDINNDIRCMGGDFNKKLKYYDYPQLNFQRQDISGLGEYQFRFIKMYNTQMEGYQKSIYEEMMNNISDKSSYSLRLSERNIGLQISNIVYMDESKDISLESYGNKGYSQYFKDRVQRKSKVCTYINPDEPILDIDSIKNISCKMHAIITGMLKDKPEGIIFIYSDFIYSGILPLAMALEHIGFEKYNGNDILDYPKWKQGSTGNQTKREPIDYQMNPMREGSKRAKYIILTGDKSLSPNNEDERKASSHENNIYGENIKVILGNTVTSEGMDFKNIREIHVLDPWYHLYKIEQIVGRGIRYCSHSLQPKEKQNVTVYLHTSSIDPKIESIDTNTYRIAEEKASQIGAIEKILKENSIDCFLNKQINMIDNLKGINILTSRKKNEKIDINDKNYTKVCSFSGPLSSKKKDKNTGCLINCNVSEEKWGKLLDNIRDDKLIDDDTFTKEYIMESTKLIYLIIKELYNEYNCYSFEEIINRIKNLIDTNKKIIYHSMDVIMDNKWIIWNNGISGYIIQSNDFYLFQPFYSNDTLIPYIYRNKNIFDIDKVHKYSSKLEVDIEEDITCDMDYNDVYEKIRNSIDTMDKDIKAFKPFLSNYQADIFVDHYIDRLTYEEKVVLLKEILCEYINNEYQVLNDKTDQMILQFFKDNLIMVDDNMEYYILDIEKGNVVGFFLFNTMEYYKDTERDVFEDYTYFIYNHGEWISLDNVGINSLKENYLKNKGRSKIFKTSSIWGYTFKDDKNNHTFKIINNATYGTKTPGKVIGNKGVKPITLLKDFSKDFRDNFTLYLKNIISMIEDKLAGRPSILEEYQRKIKKKGIDLETLIKINLSFFKEYKIKSEKNIISKEFISLLFEYSLRSNFTYFNYDLFLLKYLS